MKLPFRLTSRDLGFYTLLLIIVVYTVFPFYWAINSSIKPAAEQFTTALFPEQATLGNYIYVLSEGSFLRNLLNSVIISSLTVLVSLVVGVMCSYALARFQFRGRLTLLICILSVSMFPQIAVLSGLFELLRLVGLYNHILGLSYTYLILTLPFTVWTLTIFIKQIPKSLEESALIDGANYVQVIMHIFLPIMGPAFVTTGLLAFIVAWNEFLFALTFTLTSDARTVPVAIALMSGSTTFELPWGNIMAASVIVTVPIVILVLIFQKRIVAGLTQGAVKG